MSSEDDLVDLGSEERNELLEDLVERRESLRHRVGEEDPLSEHAMGLQARANEVQRIINDLVERWGDDD